MNFVDFWLTSPQIRNKCTRYACIAALCCVCLHLVTYLSKILTDVRVHPSDVCSIVKHGPTCSQLVMTDHAQNGLIITMCNSVI